MDRPMKFCIRCYRTTILSLVNSKKKTFHHFSTCPFHAKSIIAKDTPYEKLNGIHLALNSFKANLSDCQECIKIHTIDYSNTKTTIKAGTDLQHGGPSLSII